MYDDTAQVSVGYPRQLETIGVPGDTDLVFWVPSENALYFFHEDNYYKFEIGQTVALSQPISSKFDSAVAEADAAFAYNDGKLAKGSRYTGFPFSKFFDNLSTSKHVAN